MVLMLTRADVMSVLEMDDCIDVLEKAFAEFSNGTADLPMRIGITAPDGLNLYMPAYLKEMNALACKVVSVYKQNPHKHNLPTTIGKVLLQDPATGDVLSIMDGGYLTAVRTGAVSGLATKFLAREDQGQVAAIFGAGVQARMQLWAVCEARDVVKALVYDKYPETAQDFVEVMEEKLGIPIEIAETPEAMLEADIICTATSSPTPIFDGNKVKPGTHINGIGSHSPGARELDTAVIARSLLIADGYGRPHPRGPGPDRDRQETCPHRRGSGHAVQVQRPRDSGLRHRAPGLSEGQGRRHRHRGRHLASRAASHTNAHRALGTPPAPDPFLARQKPRRRLYYML